MQRKGFEANPDGVTMWQCDNVTDIVGSWDAHASKKAENQLVV